MFFDIIPPKLSILVVPASSDNSFVIIASPTWPFCLVKEEPPAPNLSSKPPKVFSLASFKLFKTCLPAGVLDNLATMGPPSLFKTEPATPPIAAPAAPPAPAPVILLKASDSSSGVNKPSFLAFAKIFDSFKASPAAAPVIPPATTPPGPKGLPNKPPVISVPKVVPNLLKEGRNSATSPESNPFLFTGLKLSPCPSLKNKVPPASITLPSPNFFSNNALVNSGREPNCPISFLNPNPEPCFSPCCLENSFNFWLILFKESGSISASTLDTFESICLLVKAIFLSSSSIC